MHEAEGGQGWQHVPPKPSGDFFFGQGIRPLFAFNFSGWQGSSRRLVFLPDVFLSCRVWPSPACRNTTVVSGRIRQPSEGRAGSTTPGVQLACCSKVMHFNKAPPILFLKGIDYVLLKWVLNSADPSPVGHFRGFFCLDHAWHLLANTAANVAARNPHLSSKLSGLIFFPRE